MLRTEQMVPQQQQELFFILLRSDASAKTGDPKGIYKRLFLAESLKGSTKCLYLKSDTGPVHVAA